MHPEPLDRFVDISDVEDVLEDELAFPAGIAGVDDEVDVLATGLLEDMSKAALCFFNGLQFEGSRNSRKDVELPREVFTVRTGGHLEFDEMADRGGDDRLLVFEVL